jgi:HK97 gp10 family phage protein
MLQGRVVTDATGIEQLNNLAKERSVTLMGVKAAGKIVQRAAKSGAPRVSGALKTSIGMKAKKGRKGSTGSFAVIGARKQTVKMVKRPGRHKLQKAVPAFYAHLVEKGTRPHSIGKARHPGTKPQPFLKPALDSTQAEASAAALQAMGEEVQKQIAKESAKILANLGGR